MKINVTGASGSGPTELAAFDSALCSAGIANFNLIRLSSVIPPKSEISSVDKVTDKLGSWGDRLYVVMAEARTSTPNTQVWAGVGWVQDKATGQGLFVEHEGNSEVAVRQDINATLDALMAHRNMVDLGEKHMKVVGVTCEDKPVCALAIAAYESQPWTEGGKEANR